MKFSRTYTLKEISQIIDSEYVGDMNFPVLGMNEIHVVEPGDLVFVDHPKYYDKALQSAATIILINKKVDCPEGKALLVSEDPFRDFNKLATHFRPFRPADKSIASDARIGQHTIIQPNVFIGDNVVIHPKAGIARDLESGKSFFGFYAQEKTRSWRELIALRRLPEFMNEVNRKLKE